MLVLVEKFLLLLFKPKFEGGSITGPDGFTGSEVSDRHRSGSLAVLGADLRVYRPEGSDSCLSRCGTGSDSGTARSLQKGGKLMLQGSEISLCPAVSSNLPGLSARKRNTT